MTNPTGKQPSKSIELLKKFSQDDQPFFLATGLVRPHYPNVAPKQYFDQYPIQKINLPYVPRDDWKDIPKAAISNSNSISCGIDQFQDNQKRMWAGYLATVTFVDEQIGRILQALKQLELDQNTAIIFTSDHGYLLGEHHFWQKGNLREEVTRVPLIIKVPDEKPGVSTSIVELIDIFPTACEIVDLQSPSTVQGTSLMTILKKPTKQVKKSALSFVKKGTSMRTEKWAYMKYKDGSEELYDMQEDPKQFNNLASAGSKLIVLKKLRKQFQIRNKRD